MTNDILSRVAAVLVRFKEEGHRPERLLVGHREADEIDDAIRPHLHPPPPEDQPLLPYPLLTPTTIFGVAVQRVDQAVLLGVVDGESDAQMRK